MKKFYSHGKLLLTGEYLVLDGAIALALPTKYGQNLVVEKIDAPKILWKSLDEKGKLWFNDVISLAEVSTGFISPRQEISNRLLQILQAAKQLNPEFLKEKHGYKVTTNLEFPTNWGLGTSSTLLNNLANWANIDAYQLLDKTFGGSGYDIACAQHATSISFQIQDKKKLVKPIQFNPSFKEHLYFVHLNKKQNSRDGIAQYKKTRANLNEAIIVINTISKKMLSCKTLEDFNVLLEEHEQLIAGIIEQKPIKESLFKNFNGSIKSLGAWGGDFILASSKANPTDYFKSKGYTTILSYKEMVLDGN